MSLHERLVERQSLEELERKHVKALRKGYWTQETVDYCMRKGKAMAEKLKLLVEESK